MTGLHGTAGAVPNRTMARHRDGGRYRPLVLAAIGILLTGVLAGAIQLGNSNTGMRQEIQDLASAHDNLEAQLALLSVHWNTETSRHVVMSRAAQELGLVCPEAPGTILVTSLEPHDDGATWNRILGRLEPMDPVPSALAESQLR